MTDHNMTTLSPDEHDALRTDAYHGRLALEHADAVQRLADELDEENNGTAAAVMRALLDRAFPEMRVGRKRRAQPPGRWATRDEVEEPGVGPWGSCDPVSLDDIHGAGAMTTANLDVTAEPWRQRKALHYLLSFSWPGLTEERLKRMFERVSQGELLCAEEVDGMKRCAKLIKEHEPAQPEHVRRYLYE